MKAQEKAQKAVAQKNGQGAEEKDGEEESVGREESLFTFYQRDLLRTRPWGYVVQWSP